MRKAMLDIAEQAKALAADMRAFAEKHDHRPVVQVVCAGCNKLLPESDRFKNHCQPCADALKGLYK